MMQEIYDDRTIFKKKMLQAKQDYEDTKDPKYLKFISRYNNIQMARKISLNSLMVRLVINTLDIMTLRLQKVSQLLVSCLFVGLKKNESVFEQIG